MTRLDKVKLLINEKFGGNQTDFSRAIKKSPAQINQWLNGYRNIGDAAALNIEKALGLPQGFLDGAVNMLPNVVGEDQNSKIRLPRINVEASCGAGSINDHHQEVVDYVNVTKKWAIENLGGNLQYIEVITARGDSMLPSIEDGDVMFVDTSVKRFIGEGLYLIWYADGLKAKRLQSTIGGDLMIISDNAAYRTETVKRDDLGDIHIVGSIRGAWRLNKF